MLLPFSEDLVITSRFDPETARLADLHYSRQKVGTPQFMPPGSVKVIRDTHGLLVFGWLWQEHRDDKQEGYCCSIFRNESPRLSSDVILECERIIFGIWGPNRTFTYVDPDEIQSPNPGYCFKCAGYKHVGYSKSGLHLLAKEHRN